jgi:hypothetical protein
MKFHPYSEIFPLIEGAAFDELAADIKANGLREKIWTYQDKILDGRNRFLACRKAKVDPTYRKYAGKDPLGFVISLNILRRHLNESQRAMASARISTILKGGNQHSEGVPIGTSSEMVNASERSTKRARKVIKEGSKALQQAVDNGDVSVSRAAAVVDLPKPKQLEAAKENPVLDEKWEPDPDEQAAHASMEKEYDATIDRVMGSSDPLKKAHEEIKRLTALVGTLTSSRDQYMNGHGEVVRLLKKVQNKNLRLEKQLEQSSEAA